MSNDKTDAFQALSNSKIITTRIKLLKKSPDECV